MSMEGYHSGYSSGGVQDSISHYEENAHETETRDTAAPYKDFVTRSRGDEHFLLDKIKYRHGGLLLPDNVISKSTVMDNTDEAKALYYWLQDTLGL